MDHRRAMSHQGQHQIVAERACGMKTTEQLKQKALTSVGPVITRLGKLKTAFTLSSLLYCSVHWLTSHNFSVYVFSAALVFGGVVATAVAWLSQRLSRP
jgi:hypothetical protein